MGQMPAGLARYMANKKAGLKMPAQTNAQVPPAVFHNVPGLPRVGKRHAKVKHFRATKPLM